MTDGLKHKIESLSIEDKRLLALKVKAALNSNTKNSNANSQKKIVAYIKADASLKSDELKTFLLNKLPDYMVPTSIKLIEDVPLLPNGKIDKKKLRYTKTLESSQQETTNKMVSAENDVEAKLVEIWEEVLGFSPISTTDNFFEIGGDSILSIQIISRARKLGIQLTANQLFEHQTISQLGTALTKQDAKAKKEAFDFLVPLRKQGNKKPLFCIHSGGGHVVFYNLLAKYMKSDRPIYALEPTGLYGENTMHENIEDMAMDYLKAIQSVQSVGPYNILVYCFSVTVGNKMAIELTKLGHKVNIIVMDTMANPWTLNTPLRLKARIKSFTVRFARSPITSIKHFFEDRIWRIKPFLVKYFGNEHTRDLENLQKNLRQICLAYQFKPQGGDISLILTQKAHESLQQVIIDSWEEIAEGNLKLFYTKGDHRTLFKEPDVQFASQQIDKTMVD